MKSTQGDIIKTISYYNKPLMNLDIVYVVLPQNESLLSLNEHKISLEWLIKLF